MKQVTTKNEIFNSELLADLADTLKDAGMKIYYTPGRDNGKATYFYFVEGDNIGYCQEAYFGGISFSTVHIGNKNSGTGFGLTGESGIYNPTIKDAREAFIKYPNWANKQDRESVKKYKNWEDYISRPINQILQLLPY